MKTTQASSPMTAHGADPLQWVDETEDEMGFTPQAPVSVPVGKGAAMPEAFDTPDDTGINCSGSMEMARRLTAMAEAHARGEVDHRLDLDRLPPELRDLAARVNEMVGGHVTTKHRIVEQLRAFSAGDFDRPFPPLPGQEAAVSSAMEEFRGQFRRLVDEISHVAGAICEGRLDVQPDRGAFSGAFETLIGGFAGLVDTLNVVFSTLGAEVAQSTAAVEQMSSAVKELAANSQVQSASVDEVSSSAEETDTQVKANAQAAGQANQLVTGAAAVAEEGKEKIGKMVQAMEGIRASSQDIAKIIKVIDEIAFQTNLLALNAAVEAARAGQHGRGFAVVAQEVRNLAGRSAKAARETGELIESAGARVHAGVKIADETNRAFASIAGDIDQVRSFMRDIASASDEQARGVAQINTAISEVAKTALITSQQADEVAARVAEMEKATSRMRSEIGRFRLREVAIPDAGAMPALESLPPELQAQIATLMRRGGAAAMPPATTPVRRSADRDERGFKGF